MMFGAALEPATGGAFACDVADAGSEPALTLINISLSFGGVQALSNLDLSVRQGDIHAIIGPNGAGKSSLINVISGVYRPDRGVIRIGERIFARAPTSRLSSLGVTRTFQNLALFPKLSVIDNVIVGLAGAARAGFIAQIIGLGRARAEEVESRRSAKEIITLLGLSSVQDALVGALPYGLQKRVDLARALVSRPKIVLLDEPMAGMTATEKREMAEFIATARDRLKAAVVLIEHDVGVVMSLSDRVTVLDCGRKIAEGSPAEIRANSDVIDAYLGVIRDDNVMEQAA
jgi:branched-chain amino acid transport system ATP-binding protein